MEDKFNRANLADLFSNTQSYTDSFPGKYYKHTSEVLSNYTKAIPFDRRNIATGGVDLSIFPWEMFADTDEKVLKSYSITQVFQDLLYKLKNPKTVLFCSAAYSSTNIIQQCENPEITVTVLNSISLDHFEKCVKTINNRFANIDYNVLSIQDLLTGNSSKFDMIEVWGNQLDTSFSDVNTYISLLNKDGVLLINDTSDWAFLYDNATTAHPMFDLHEQLIANESVYIYHIPVHYGFSVVIKK